MSLLRGGIHGGTLSGEGREKCRRAVEYCATDRDFGVLPARSGWRAERLAHGYKEARRGCRDAWMRERGVQRGGMGSVSRGWP